MGGAMTVVMVVMMVVMMGGMLVGGAWGGIPATGQAAQRRPNEAAVCR
jgi:ABC-type uncharacterized transport system permease subunit